MRAYKLDRNCIGNSSSNLVNSFQMLHGRHDHQDQHHRVFRNDCIWAIRRQIYLSYIQALEFLLNSFRPAAGSPAAVVQNGGSSGATTSVKLPEGVSSSVTGRGVCIAAFSRSTDAASQPSTRRI